MPILELSNIINDLSFILNFHNLSLNYSEGLFASVRKYLHHDKIWRDFPHKVNKIIRVFLFPISKLVLRIFLQIPIEVYRHIINI